MLSLIFGEILEMLLICFLDTDRKALNHQAGERRKVWNPNGVSQTPVLYLFCIGADAFHKVGLRLTQRFHQLVQRGLQHREGFHWTYSRQWAVEGLWAQWADGFLFMCECYREEPTACCLMSPTASRHLPPRFNP